MPPVTFEHELEAIDAKFAVDINSTEAQIDETKRAIETASNQLVAMNTSKDNLYRKSYSCKLKLAKKYIDKNIATRTYKLDNYDPVRVQELMSALRESKSETIADRVNTLCLVHELKYIFTKFPMIDRVEAILKQFFDNVSKKPLYCASSCNKKEWRGLDNYTINNNYEPAVDLSVNGDYGKYPIDTGLFVGDKLVMTVDSRLHRSRNSRGTCRLGNSGVRIVHHYHYQRINNILMDGWRILEGDSVISLSNLTVGIGESRETLTEFNEARAASLSLSPNYLVGIDHKDRSNNQSSHEFTVGFAHELYATLGECGADGFIDHSIKVSGGSIFEEVSYVETVSETVSEYGGAIRYGSPISAERVASKILCNLIGQIPIKLVTLLDSLEYSSDLLSDGDVSSKRTSSYLEEINKRLAKLSMPNVASASISPTFDVSIKFNKVENIDPYDTSKPERLNPINFTVPENVRLGDIISYIIEHSNNSIAYDTVTCRIKLPDGHPRFNPVTFMKVVNTLVSETDREFYSVISVSDEDKYRDVTLILGLKVPLSTFNQMFKRPVYGYNMQVKSKKHSFYERIIGEIYLIRANNVKEK